MANVRKQGQLLLICMLCIQFLHDILTLDFCSEPFARKTRTVIEKLLEVFYGNRSGCI